MKKNTDSNKNLENNLEKLLSRMNTNKKVLLVLSWTTTDESR